MPDRMPVEGRVGVCRVLSSIGVDAAQAIAVELAENGDPPWSEQELRGVERHDHEAGHAFGEAVDVDVDRIAGLVRRSKRLDLLGSSRIPGRVALAEGVLRV